MTYIHRILFAVSSLLWTLQDCQGANVTNIRLANASPNGRFGRLEIQVNGADTWGVVCDDGWSSEDNVNAIVACRQLKFTNGGKAIFDDKYGRGTGGFLLDDTKCEAGMTTLAQCSSAQQDNCGPSDSVVGLECNANSGAGITTFQPPVVTTISGGAVADNCNDPSITSTVELFGKPGIDGMGYVRVLNPANNQWGFVCDDGWDSLAAKVVCAQLCFPTNYTAKPGIPAEHRVLPQSPTITLDSVKCQGSEATLQECSHNNFATTNDCSVENAEFAGVQCVEAAFSSPLPPDPILECGGGLIKASFLRSRDDKLEMKHLSVLNDETCPDVKKSTTDDFVSITIPVDKCGTNLSRNGTHIIYENAIKYASTSEEGPITRFNTYRVAVMCAMPVDKKVTQRVQPVTESVTVNADGIITAGMGIYRSDSFQNAVTENPVRVPLGEYLNMAINMEQYDSRLKIVVTDCVSTPTGDTTNTRLTKNLYINKCIEETTLSVYPLSNSEFAFRFKPFKFVNYPLLYIQCSAIVCLASDITAECDRSCNNTKPVSSGRRKRSVMMKQTVESQAILIYDPYEPPKDDGDDHTQVIISVDNFDEDDPQTPKPDHNSVDTTPQPPIQLETPGPSLTSLVETADDRNDEVNNNNNNNLEVGNEGDIGQQGEDNSLKGNNSSRMLPAMECVLFMLITAFLIAEL